MEQAVAARSPYRGMIVPMLAHVLPACTRYD